MSQRLLQSVALITGASRGIGREIAHAYAKEGAKLCLVARSQTALDEVVTELALPADRVMTVALDVTDRAACFAAVQATQVRFGHIDILVNNAGITGGNAPTWELDPEVWRRVIEVNLIAPYLTCRAVAPHMTARGWGRIVNVASVAGKEGNPNASHYSASKAGVIALTKSLAKEVATQGVLVNAIAPAVARTALFAQMTEAHIAYMLGKIPMGRFVEVEEIAAMIAWLSSDDCSFTTGSVFDISGGRATY